MAVVNAYVETLVAAGKKTSALSAAHAENFAAVVTFEVAAADDNDSVYRVLKGLNPDLVPISLTIMCDAVTGMSDVNVGLYASDLGAVADENCLADALDLSSASKILDGLKDVAIENRGKKLWELAGHTAANKLASYDLTLKAVAAASTAGTVTVIAQFAQGS